MSTAGTNPPDGRQSPSPPPDNDPQQAGGWQHPAPLPQQRTGGVGQPADLGPRFVARLLDFILLGVVSSTIGTLLVVGALLGSDVGLLSAWGVEPAESYVANAASSAFSVVISLGYFALMESKLGQTLGKMLLRLQTRGRDGGRPTFGQALKRNAFTAIPILGIIPFLGFVSGLLSLLAVITIAATISSDTVTRRGWHDRLADGTTVVRVG